jgi:hypothetical protein
MRSAAPLVLAAAAAAALLFAQRREAGAQVVMTKTTAKRTVEAQAGETWKLTAQTNLPASLIPDVTQGIRMRTDSELVGGPEFEGGRLSYTLRYTRGTLIELGARIEMGAYWIELVDAQRVGGAE